MTTLGNLGITLRAYPTMLRIGLAEAVAYRAEMLVWMLTTTMPMVSLSLWSAVARASPIGGFTPQRFSAYFLATLVVRQLTGCWLVWEMNAEIRSGGLSRRLMRPIHPLIAYSADNLAAIPLRAALAVPVAIVLVFALEPLPAPPSAARLALFTVSLVGAWLINFFTMAVIGTLAFFIETSTAVFDVWLLLFTLLSGYLVPLDLFPRSLGVVARALPFRYTLAFPVELFIGALDPPRVGVDLGIQWAYVAGTGVLAHLGWRAGLKRFAAFGG